MKFPSQVRWLAFWAPLSRSEGLKGVIFPRTPGPLSTSGPGGNPEVSRSIPDIRDLMSGIGGKLTVVATWPEQPLVAEAVEKVGAIGFCATIVPVG